jgi:hypothetical protein
VILWVESQSTEVIALIVFGLSYLTVALIVLGCILLGRSRVAADLKAVTPVMLTPLSVIVGLLIVFLANRVWANLDRAHMYVAQEAGAIHDAVWMSQALPVDVQGRVKASIAVYLDFVEHKDWPAMAVGQADINLPVAGITEATRVLLSFVPASESEKIAHQRVVAALEEILAGRRNRILLSMAVISALQWIAIIVLELLLLLTATMVHIDRPVTAAITCVLLSTAIACCLVLLMVHDRPFAAGGLTVEPTMLRSAMVGG